MQPRLLRRLVLGLDLNDGLGVKIINGQECLDTDETVGECQPGIQGEAGDRLRAIMKLNKLCAVNTFHNAGMTFWSHHGSRTKIDYKLIPQALLPRVVLCRVDARLARRVQLINAATIIDHLPLRVEFRYILYFAPPPSRCRWDYDALGVAMSGQK